LRARRDAEIAADAVVQLVDLDATSEAFRYPAKRNGDSTLPPDLKDFDLGQVRDVVTRLGIFLDAVATHTSVMLDYKDEIESAYEHGFRA
jgi:hypothetical protein